MWEQAIKNISAEDAGQFSASTQNLLSIYSAATSIIYGLGCGFFASVVLSYCAVITEPHVSGKNFGFLYLVWSIHLFLTYAITNFFSLSIMGHMWIFLIVAYLSLTLSNPKPEQRCISAIKHQ